ncbi:HU family DNA-binding protein [Paenibacillus sp. EKM102P]|uniref:HU family DNA-binding protein n=1 Tax=unclassified Paenibacillus TaxID=185978 RepID=UPI00142E26B8|nr:MULTISPECIES: HU family DNA-binding protein [unclassified Paenibacillus]KAF6620454.1 HU family DNA-binding protein [Paenibacillus sp. EKM101P]KAF6623446.1 HU family DNA-binding protein [Paenibacillus sp. EKM102P]KAF6633992.1 HU family DNA-binding protein [Paenibacillus sp. EKM10P]KAF6649518.1 HU family DNA-binding protein [Paenibacillus sp. EKM11P]
MNKTELVKSIAEATGFTKKDVETTVDTLLTTITNTLATGEEVKIAGFGTFEVRETAARNGINPKLLGELKEQGVDPETAKAQATIAISASKKPAFKAAKALKDQVKQ